MFNPDERFTLDVDAFEAAIQPTQPRSIETPDPEHLDAGELMSIIEVLGGHILTSNGRRHE